MKQDEFTSIKQIPKEAIEMIDDVQWWVGYSNSCESPDQKPERLNSIQLLDICNNIDADGRVIQKRIAMVFDIEWLYIEPRELEDKTYGINLYKKIHGTK